MKLENIGFYTLSDARAEQASHESPLWRCEMLVTKRCNFSCPYCRSVGPDEDVSWENALKVLKFWCDNGLRNVRFSGGEPTLWDHLLRAVGYCESRGVERIAISTNGSMPAYVYAGLYSAGVTDFSISLDACCAEDNEKMTGGRKVFDQVISNIQMLSELTYVTVGVVLTDDNENNVVEIVELAKSLGVSDIRVIPAAQHGSRLTFLPKSNMPILEYRKNLINEGQPIRGLRSEDNDRCPLVMDDMAVIGNYHYPCIIYARENGKPIGSMDGNVREDRRLWAENHNVKQDFICANNCLDVCRDYNNRHREFADERN